MRHYWYRPEGVCCRMITFYLEEDGTIHEVRFARGCAGLTAAVSALVEGMNAEDVIKRLAKIKCPGQQSSCPDQLAAALRLAVTNMLKAR